MNFGLGNMMSALAGKLPQLEQLMDGYEVKDGQLKASVIFATSDDTPLPMNGNVIKLVADENVMVVPYKESVIKTNLTLTIKASTIVFVYDLVHGLLTSMGTNIVTSDTTEPVSFRVISNTGKTVSVKKGTVLGYGYFQPIVPMNNIAFTKQDAT